MKGTWMLLHLNFSPTRLGTRKRPKDVCSMKEPNTRPPGSHVIYSASYASPHGCWPQRHLLPFSFHLLWFWYPSLPLLNYHTGMVVKLQKATIQAKSFDTICFPRNAGGAQVIPWPLDWRSCCVCTAPPSPLPTVSVPGGLQRWQEQQHNRSLNLVINTARWRNYHHSTWRWVYKKTNGSRGKMMIWPLLCSSLREGNYGDCFFSAPLCLGNRQASKMEIRASEGACTWKARRAFTGSLHDKCSGLNSVLCDSSNSKY